MNNSKQSLKIVARDLSLKEAMELGDELNKFGNLWKKQEE